MECKKNPALAPVILFPKWEDKILISTSFFKIKTMPQIHSLSSSPSIFHE